MRPLFATALAVGLGCAIAGIEVALVLPLRPLAAHGVTWPTTLVGVLGAVLLAAGLLPAYHEIWKRRGRVIGIDMRFLLLDWGGAVFSLASLGAQREFDVLGGVQYAVCAGLEMGVMGFWAVDRMREWRKGKREDVEGRCEAEIA